MPPGKCAISLETAFTQGGTFSHEWNTCPHMGLQYNKSGTSIRQASSRLVSGGVYPATRVALRCALMSVVERAYAVAWVCFLFSFQHRGGVASARQALLAFGTDASRVHRSVSKFSNPASVAFCFVETEAFDSAISLEARRRSWQPFEKWMPVSSPAGCDAHYNSPQWDQAILFSIAVLSRPLR